MDKTNINIQLSSFGQLSDGRDVTKYTLSNANNFRISLIDFGATITSVLWPNKKNGHDDVTLGFADLEGYIENPPSFGSTIGRVINRIHKGKFTIDDEDYQLVCNAEGGHHIHGGMKGFSKVLWDATLHREDDKAGVVFTYLSPHGEEGYPGNLLAKVGYYLTDYNALIMEFYATTDRPTIVNLSNHAYWNLSPKDKDVSQHQLQIQADYYLPSNQDNLPTGEILSVKDSVMDFTQSHDVGKHYVKLPKGYDNYYVLDKSRDKFALGAKVMEPVSQRCMEVWTTYPGLQLYTSGNLQPIQGRDGATHGPGSALCLETQHFPDAIHHAHFPTILLKPSQRYHHITEHRFIDLT